jgi:hypothetical protein
MIQFRRYLLSEKKIRLAEITIFSLRSLDELTLYFFMTVYNRLFYRKGGGVLRRVKELVT